MWTFHFNSILRCLSRDGSEGSHVLERLSHTNAPHSKKLYLLAAALATQVRNVIAPLVNSTHRQAGQIGYLTDRRTSESGGPRE